MEGLEHAGCFSMPSFVELIDGWEMRGYGSTDKSGLRTSTIRSDRASDLTSSTQEAPFQPG
jgi:hypothetical protein